MSGHWFWLTVGLILATAEIIAPGVFLIWLAGAAMITGLLLFFVPVTVPVQIVIFAVCATILVSVARRWFAQNPIETKDPLLNNRSARLIGQIVIVVEPITSSSGRVRVGDSVWSASGVDADIGTAVRITGGDGSRLSVEPI